MESNALAAVEFKATCLALMDEVALAHLMTVPDGELTVEPSGYTVADNLRKWEARLAAESLRFAGKVVKPPSLARSKGKKKP